MSVATVIGNHRDGYSRRSVSSCQQWKPRRVSTPCCVTEKNTVGFLIRMTVRLKSYETRFVLNDEEFFGRASARDNKMGVSSKNS